LLAADCGPRYWIAGSWPVVSFKPRWLLLACLCSHMAATYTTEKSCPLDSGNRFGIVVVVLCASLWNWAVVTVDSSTLLYSTIALLGIGTIRTKRQMQESVVAMVDCWHSHCSNLSVARSAGNRYWKRREISFRRSRIRITLAPWWLGHCVHNRCFEREGELHCPGGLCLPC